MYKFILLLRFLLTEFLVMQLRRERDRLRHKMDMFKKTLSSELLTMQLKGSNSSDSM